MGAMTLDSAEAASSREARSAQTSSHRLVRLLLVVLLLTGYGAWAAASWQGQYRAVSAVPSRRSATSQF